MNTLRRDSYTASVAFDDEALICAWYCALGVGTPILCAGSDTRQFLPKLAGDLSTASPHLWKPLDIVDALPENRVTLSGIRPDLRPRPYRQAQKRQVEHCQCPHCRVKVRRHERQRARSARVLPPQAQSRARAVAQCRDAARTLLWSLVTCRRPVLVLPDIVPPSRWSERLPLAPLPRAGGHIRLVVHACAGCAGSGEVTTGSLAGKESSRPSRVLPRSSFAGAASGFFGS